MRLIGRTLWLLVRRPPPRPRRPDGCRWPSPVSPLGTPLWGPCARSWVAVREEERSLSRGMRGGAGPPPAGLDDAAGRTIPPGISGRATAGRLSDDGAHTG